MIKKLWNVARVKYLANKIYYNVNNILILKQKTDIAIYIVKTGELFNEHARL